LIIGFGQSVEIISYGYKSINRIPVQYMTKWNSNEINPLIRTIDGYFGLVNKMQQQSIFTTDDVFSVKAYGKFFEATYQQLDNSGNIVVVNAKLNRDAIRRACYILESYADNSYTIDPTGLIYKTDIVCIVDKYGNPIHKNDDLNEDLEGIIVNNKYIVGDFQGTEVIGKDSSGNNTVGSDMTFINPPISYTTLDGLSNITESTFFENTIR
jgi:hypothetical protein